MNNHSAIRKLNKTNHIDEVIEMAGNWWVYRRTVNHHGMINSTARIVFFAQTKEATDKWLASNQ